tara:strand:- start:1308 stop:1571 length:264 start_codon:yes stop_codon:yes gene_type:complete
LVNRKRNLRRNKAVKLEQIFHLPEQYGDNWSDQLEKADLNFIINYFKQMKHLEGLLGNIHFKVGGVENTIRVSNQKKIFFFKCLEIH